MQNPPPYPGQQKSPNQTLSTVLIVVSLSCVALCGVGGFVAYKKGIEAANSIMPIIGCSADFEAVGAGILAYAKDKKKLPDSAKWQSQVLEYVKKELKTSPIGADEIEGMQRAGITMRRMKVDGNWGCSVDATTINGFAFNTELSGKKLEDIVSKSKTALVFESDQQAKMNLSMIYKKLPDTAKPEVMGQPRAYLVFYADGSFENSMSDKSKGAKVKISTNSSP